VLLPTRTATATCDCGRSQSELYALLQKYNADVNKLRLEKNVDVTTARVFFSSTFNQTFNSGSEASPTCSKHGRPNAELRWAAVR
jgi:hypothetical protein